MPCWLLHALSLTTCLWQQHCWTQALLHAESKLRSQEIEAGLLQEAATNLNTAAVAAEEAALRGALAAHGREAAAAQRQLTHLFAERQQAQQQSIKRRQQAEEQDRCAELATQSFCAGCAMHQALLLLQSLPQSWSPLV